MFLDILDEKRLLILNKLSKLECVDKFVMGGGTGLSLQLRLRISYDFDFFTTESFNVNLLLVQIEDIFENQVRVLNKEERLATLDLDVDGVRISFMEYKHKAIGNYVFVEQIMPIKIFSLEDIACMKSVAIIQRGTKKDFYDMFFVLKKLNLSPGALKKLLLEKYHSEDLLVKLLMSIAYFEDAENEMLPKSFVDYSWEEIKNYFVKLQIALNKII